MTKRSFPAVLFPAIFLSMLCTFGSLVGCQTGSSTSMAYPAPSFSAPRMTVQQPAPLPPAPLAFYHPQPAPHQSAAAQPPRTAVAPRPTLMVGIPVSWIPPVPARPWRGIVIHHSATTTGGAAKFDQDHREKGWDELGYDFVIGNGSDTGNGQVEVGPRWVKQKIGAHAKSSDNRYNEYYIGICLVGNFDEERPTPQQMASLEKLVVYLMRTYRIQPDMIVGHNNTKSTDCPGKYFNVAVVRRDVAAMLGSRTYAAKPKSELLTAVSNSR